MKCRGCALRINSTEPSVEPESITISSQFLYSCAFSAGKVSRSAHASLHERTMMLTSGSFTTVSSTTNHRRESWRWHWGLRSEEHTSELQSLTNLVCRLLLEKKKRYQIQREFRAAVTILTVRPSTLKASACCD